ncbi:very short patch repair endonuclease [Microbacterium sp. ASV49]|uniref:Very short patch repair endonuclease n=1 Tax=Microbacterium candidum TaxID=3041922 RepID=A0ABT7N3F2_9MICO|nr:very short patch repair endonuclease [Microbacterium sp. ASV49]MDL9981195.1 very short patch repair endonuclease [Microbacterium sp. ASV49]
MKGNKRRDTSFELAVRCELHRRGFRYRVDFAPLATVRSRADIVFRGARVAVYLDGCFWHGCPVHATSPKSNASYWLPKLERNRERDSQINGALRAEGWMVLRFWEHEPPGDIAQRIADEVRARRLGEQTIATDAPSREPHLG